MSKKTYVTAYLNNNFSTLLESYINSGLPMEVGLGKYSSYIYLKRSNKKIKFITGFHSRQTFIGYGMILKDLKRPEIEVLISDLEDNVSEDSNVYYSTGKYETCEFPNAVCVDLNSAYLQALFNLGLITEKTKTYIDKVLTKQERLVAVGMLAKRKEIVHFIDGKIQQDYVDESKLRFVFNAAIQEVAAVMKEVKTHFADDFIAYWVDGIFMKNEFIGYEIEQLFNSYGFPAKTEDISNFKSVFRFDAMEYTYSKEGKPKSLRIPIATVFKEIKKNALNVLNKKRREIDMGDVSDYDFEVKFHKQAQLFEKN